MHLFWHVDTLLFQCFDNQFFNLRRIVGIGLELGGRGTRSLAQSELFDECPDIAIDPQLWTDQ